MGHLVGKDIYGALGEKIDNLHVRTPQNKAFYEILRELYSPDEAELIVKMPFTLSSLDRIAKTTGSDPGELEPMLTALCEKGLVMDLCLDGAYRYMPSPFVIGIFEFTMMRMDSSDENIGKYSKLFVDYLHGGEFFSANFKDKQQVSFARALPHLDDVGDHVEILDYEKIDRVIDETDTFAVSNCQCRHKKHHAGLDVCDVPLETCTTFGKGADYVVRRGMGRKISKEEMKDIAQRSKELKLVFSADNVQNRPMFICHCCGCCCGILEGINEHGYANTIVSSTLLPHIDLDNCNGCHKCARACHIGAVLMIPTPMKAGAKTKFKAKIDESACIGCGVCGLACDPDAIEMRKREQNVIHPETTFERVILQCLERGTLQNQLFDDPGSLSHKTMRGIVGGFLRLAPVKKALMSETLRSRFLSVVGAGASMTGKEHLHEL